MTDKEKIREEVEKLKSNLIYGACSSQIAMETMCKEEAYNEILAILDSMQEEPVSEGLIDVAKQYVKEHVIGIDKFTFSIATDMFISGAKWQKEQFEKDYTDLCNGIATAKGVAVAMAYDKGMADAKEQMVKNLWKPADGEDLPEYEREVIVLIKYYAHRNIHDKEYSTYRVGFGHRPNPDGWDGKNIDTNEVTHYTPKLYDKGGWNAPDVVYWLDVKLPKEIEL